MQLRNYKVEVAFRNEGEVYGRETYDIMAFNEDQARRKALTNASSSPYDDERLPDRRVSVSNVEEIDDLDEAA